MPDVDNTLYALLRGLPDTRTDEELEDVVNQYRNGGKLTRDRVGETPAIAKLLDKVYRDRVGSNAVPAMQKDYINLVGLFGGLNAGTNKLAANPEAFWPEGAKAQYGREYFPGDTKHEGGTLGVVSYGNRDTAHVATYGGDTLPHELTHTGQLRSDDTTYNHPGTMVKKDPRIWEQKFTPSPEYDKVAATIKDMLAADEDLKYELPSNMFDADVELPAALMGREGALPAEEDVSKDRILGFIMKDPALKQWYMNATNRWDENTSKPQKAKQVGDELINNIRNILPPAIRDAFL